MALSGCGKPKLDKPEGLIVDQDTLVLSWDKVEDARYYTIQIKGAETKKQNSSTNAFSLAYLDAGKYTITVKAYGKEDEVEPSAWSKEFAFEREQETGMVFTLSEDGKSYAVTGKGIATGDIVIPATYRSRPVTAIGEKAFFNKSDITSVTLNDNIKRIEAQAFANCSYITNITMPAELEEIGQGAFQSCRLLETAIVLPNTLTSLGDNAFAYCRALPSVTIGSGLKEINKSAFSNCDMLAQIVVPDTIERIGEYAFADCKAATSLTLGRSVKEIGGFAFAACSSLTSVAVPNSVTVIGEGAFNKCELLNSVTLGSGLEQLCVGAFLDSGVWNNTTAQNEVYVDGWFVGCKDKTVASLNIVDGTKGIADYAVFGNAKITSIVLPASVKTIGDFAFAAMDELTSVIIGMGVERIGEQAFTQCKKLEKAILGAWNYDDEEITGSGLVEIGEYAFNGCTKLSSIEIPESVKIIGPYAFKGTAMWASSTSGVVYAGNWLVGGDPALVTGSVTVAEGTVGIANYAFYTCSNLQSILYPIR
jgi:hypothetical protein